jgi:NAD(P)-dependent dehydrogenase (short-subunit alcohol dehydrogenase family)
MMSGRSIFITGAGSGIGLATARLLVGEGWKVGVCDLDTDRMTEAFGSKANIYKANVTQFPEIKAAIEDFAESSGGKLGALFNCAGILDMRMFEQTPIEKMHAICDVNIKGVLNGTAAALPFLKKSNDSKVVTMSSMSAMYGIAEQAAYSASKFAVRGLTEALNIELESEGIWVCDIMVSYVRTPMTLQATHKAKSMSILGVDVEPDQVAATVKEALSGRKVHWFVMENSEAFADRLAKMSAEERRQTMRKVTGFDGASSVQ